MKTSILMIASVGLISAAGVASAAVPMNDTDFVRASRCSGIAAGLGADATDLKTRLKAEARIRPPMVQSQADDEFDRAKRQARSNPGRLRDEFSGPCAAYLATPTKSATR